MNDADLSIRAGTIPPQKWPFPLAPTRQRQAAAAFRRAAGELLALKAEVTLDDPMRAAFLINRLPRGASAWPVPTRITLDTDLPAAVSAILVPVLVDNGPEDFVVVWPLEANGCALIGPTEARLIGTWSDGIVTAFAIADGQIGMAVAPDSDGARAEVRVAPLTGLQAGPWKSLSAGDLPCADDELVTAMALFGGHVYAAKGNARGGFELWRAPLEGSGDWALVIPRGGWRYGSSPSVTAMAVVADRLFVAARGADRSEVRVGDEYPEILAVDRDGGWRIFCGQDRFSPTGLLLPEAPVGTASSRHAGMAIGGIEPEGDGGLRIWLKPLDPDLVIAQVMSWSPGGAGWQVEREVAVGSMDVLTLVTLKSGGGLVTSAKDFAHGTAQDPGDWPVLQVLD